MGLGIAQVKFNLELWQLGFFKNIKSVVDMGSQELHLSQIDFEELLCAADISNYKKENFPNIANWPKRPRCSAKYFYELLGAKEYACIDLGGMHGAIRHDLNFPFEDTSHYNKYDLVSDYGNNEHIFNTVEAYRTMHRLCKPDGYIVIDQGFYNLNGYYGYDPSFFEGLAAANNYTILFSSAVVYPKVQTKTGTDIGFHIPLSRELLDALDWTKIKQIAICYFMQKKLISDFRYPYQGHLLSKSQGHYGYKLQFLSMPPSRTYIPLNADQAIPTKSLPLLFFKRITKKIKSYFV